MTKEQRAIVIRARAKLRKIKTPCDEACPGWAVIENGRSATVLQRCDDCFHGVEDKLMDDEVEALPEAQALLAETLALQARENDLALRVTPRGDA
jgi:hypothetical protein